MLVFDIFDLPPKVKGFPGLKLIRFAMQAAELVGQEAGALTVARIETAGAASGPVFSQEMFDYEISAIRMGAQI